MQEVESEFNRNERHRDESKFNRYLIAVVSSFSKGNSLGEEVLDGMFFDLKGEYQDKANKALQEVPFLVRYWARSGDPGTWSNDEKREFLKKNLLLSPSGITWGYWPADLLRKDTN